MANPDDVRSIEDFLGIFAETVKDDKITPYKPSNGEQSMLVLNYALLDDTKKYFVLDEPEMSVGHKYINQVIVPRLKELARQEKVVIVSTHDANIAIRTLPFLSIYREDLGSGNYTTYVGNPFIEMMRNYDNKELQISWAKTSIDTLEGGKEAFIERGEAYGKERI
jgi:ABC-type Mn2+/Zn2+ transport system ATPase subunit